MVPKSRRGFRIAHQLSAHDTLIYLASVIENAEILESLRTPVDEGTAFSYRYKNGEGPRIFEVGGTYHDWMVKLTEFGGTPAAFGEARTVISTDISDFYQRIYHHRIENILATYRDKHSAEITKKIIKSVRANQSFGIPVGQTASRFLAELVLNDTDQFLIELGVPSTRYVDDFRIIVENEQIAHSTLCKLAEHLMITEGLSLNGSKTDMTTVASAQRDAQKRLEDVFTDKDQREFQNYLRLTYEDDTTKDDSEDDVAEAMFFDANDLADKITEFVEYGRADLSTYKAILRAIRSLGGVDSEKITKHHSQFLYYIPREFCLSLSKMDRSDEEKVKSTKDLLIKLLNESPFKDLVLCRYWIIDLFVRGCFEIDWKDFQSYDFNRSTVERRAMHLLRGRLGHAAYFRAQKTKFGELNDWEKPAFLLGAMCLPKDEYEKWVVSVQNAIPGPLAAEYADWVKGNWGNLPAILDY